PAQRPPRHIPPSPTRRSSDLFEPEGTLRRVRDHDVSYLSGAPTVLNRLIAYYGDNPDVVTTGERDVRISTAGSAPATATLSTIEDRKSTRLNSSHVSISYAGF